MEAKIRLRFGPESDPAPDVGRWLKDFEIARETYKRKRRVKEQTYWRAPK
jgi:hypothetical protein